MIGLAEYATSLAFLGVLFALFLGAEIALPHRAEQRPDPLRLVQSIVLFALGGLLVRVALPLTVIGAALLAHAQGWGLLNLAAAPLWLAIPVTILAMDFTNFARHWAEHNVPFLWRIHRLHHSDIRIDLATAFRFHPLEALLTSGCHLAMVLLLGMPMEGVLLYLVAELVFDLWEHSNVQTPRRLVRLTPFIVTPQVHRVHHEAFASNKSHNYGTVLTLWDRLARTYIAPTQNRQTQRFGLHETEIDPNPTLQAMLADPLKGNPE